jgi:hypothetical protein
MPIMTIPNKLGWIFSNILNFAIIKKFHATIDWLSTVEFETEIS